MVKLVVLGLLFVQFVWEQFLVFINIRFIEKKASGDLFSLPQALKNVISKDEYKKAAEYSRAKANFTLIVSTLNFILIAFVLAFSLLKPIDSLFFGVPFGRVLFCLTILFIMQIIAIPFKAYNTFIIEKKFGFNKSTVKVFFMDILKGLIISMLILFPLLWLLFKFYDIVGQNWWIFGFFLFTGFQVLMLFVYPVLIAPIFNKFTPLKEGELLGGIKELAKKAGFPLKGVFLMDGSKRSSHSNAYFTGIGRSKRIVLFDTLIERLTTNELICVLAHELGHFKLHHVKIHLLFSTIFSFLTFYVLGLLLTSTSFFNHMGYEKPQIHIGLVLLAIMLPIVEVVFNPLFNYMSRKHEYAADNFAKKLCQEGGKSLSSALIKLNKDNLSAPQPHPLYSFMHYSHPPLAERLEKI